MILCGSLLSEPDREQQCFTHLSDSFPVHFWLHTVSSVLFDGSMFVTPPFPACPPTKLHSTNFQISGFAIFNAFPMLCEQ